MKRKSLNNKGYSLVEIIVVIALIAIGVTAFAISIGVVFSNNVRSCATDISSLISKGKVSANYRPHVVYVEIDIDGNELVGRYYEGGSLFDGSEVPLETKVLGSANINVNLTGFSTTSLPVIIAFKRETGEMMEWDYTNGILKEFSAGAVPRITLGNSTASNYTIVLTPFTGNHEVVKG